MPNQQLIDYIKQAQAAGQSKEQIRAALLGAGWQEQDVDDVLSGAVLPVQSATSGASHSSKLIIIAVLLAAILFIAGGGLAYFFIFTNLYGKNQWKRNRNSNSGSILLPPELLGQMIR